MSAVGSLLTGESKLAAPSTKRQCTSSATENPNSAWYYYLLGTPRRGEDELWVRMLLSLSIEGPVEADGVGFEVRCRFARAVQQLLKIGKEDVLVQYFLALFERTKCWDDWPDEAKSKTIANAVREYFSETDFGSTLRDALYQALVKAADAGQA